MNNYNQHKQYKKTEETTSKKRLRQIEQQYSWVASTELAELAEAFSEPIKVWAWFREAFFDRKAKEIIFDDEFKYNWVCANYRSNLRKAGFGQYKLKLKIPMS